MFKNWLRKIFQEELTNLQEIILFHQHQSDELRAWLNAERDEKEQFKNLLFSQLGLGEQQAQGKSYSEIKPIQAPRIWPKIRAGLESRDREQHWKDKVAREKAAQAAKVETPAQVDKNDTT